MDKFSDRYGITTKPTKIQIEEMSDDLRNSLWNVLDSFLWNKQGFRSQRFSGELGDIAGFSRLLWMNYFKEPMDSIPRYSNEIISDIRTRFYSYPWYEVYNFMEFIIRTFKTMNIAGATNKILERELSGYRYISDGFVPVTEGREVKEIENAVQVPFAGVSEHIRSAIRLLGPGENADPRNSIKESISSVESMAREITGDDKATLGKALKVIENDHGLHPALKEGFSKLYGYVSDENGVRHALMEASNLTIDDATYFLVTCSAFVNYLKTKMA